ncbi:MAG: TolC family protein [Bacteroidetes bacterium]|jgi:outer membrane protein|nr:TolC family protein [Bacteroidota bacterium]
MKYLFVFLGVMCVSFIHAQDTEAYTLQKCIDIALKNNLAVITAELQSKSSSVQLQQSAAAALPSVSAYANQGISTGKSINPYTNTFINQEVTTGQYGVNGSLTLFSGLYNYNTFRQSMYNNHAGRMDLEQAKLDISIQVTLAYMQVLTNQELLNQALSQMEVTQAQIDRLSVLDKNNAVSPSVLYDTKGQLANDKIYLINIKASLLTAKLNLGQLMNVTFSPAATFEGMGVKEIAEVKAEPQQTFSEVSKTLPAIRSAEYRRQGAKKGWHAAGGLLFPTVNLNASLGTNYSSAASSQKVANVYDAATDAYITVGATPYLVFQPQYEYTSEKISFTDQLKNNLNTYVGVGVQLTLFNGLRTRTQVANSKINYELARSQQKNTETRYKAVIEQLCNDLLSSAERTKVLQEQVNDYTESFRIATAKFEKGAITTYDYITAKTNFEKSKANLITSQYEYALRSKVLALYKGEK